MSVFNHEEFSGHEQVVFVSDQSSGLKAIIALHDTTLGIAAGGIRMRAYEDSEQALADVLRLSRGMTYKSALAGLPLGGGKTVVIGDPATAKTPELLEALGKAIDSLGGRYSAGEDVGMGDEDMEVIARQTSYVARGEAADTAPDTAKGVYLAMQTAVRNKLSRDTMAGVQVAIQGMGKVAFHLAELLVNDGAKVVATDIDQAVLDRAVTELGVETVSPEEITYLDVDVFAPCALGAILNNESIPQIQASIICGAANNQLAKPEHDQLLREHDILFMPDYAINAGGIISGACRFAGLDDATREAMLAKISTTSQQIIDLADEQNIGTQLAADQLAEQIITAAK
ncbi:Glu/Leu/Phe/Val dehydrogenase dimerization domain-containing protein [Maricurvus nonylphenolicus]|uniref:Glu/Leu/Phe/Val family dehydrogenase n=1 Tax=Maricurvus nonylphenolicus TaxID=1008307 RepID=UPI0036F3B004